MEQFTGSIDAASSVAPWSTGNTIGVIVECLLIAFYMFCLWKLFVKAGHKGYESLIKGHNGYLLVTMAGRPGWYYFFFMIPIIALVLGIMQSVALVQYGPAGTTFQLNGYLLVAFITGLALYIDIVRQLGKKFGKGLWFRIGLVGLPMIFLPILALDKSKYKK